MKVILSTWKIIGKNKWFLWEVKKYVEIYDNLISLSFLFLCVYVSHAYLFFVKFFSSWPLKEISMKKIKKLRFNLTACLNLFSNFSDKSIIFPTIFYVAKRSTLNEWDFIGNFLIYLPPTFRTHNCSLMSGNTLLSLTKSLLNEKKNWYIINGDLMSYFLFKWNLNCLTI